MTQGLEFEQINITGNRLNCQFSRPVGPEDIPALVIDSPSFRVSETHNEVLRVTERTQGHKAHRDKACGWHADASRPKIRSLNILDLPYELLLDICEYVAWVSDNSDGCYWLYKDLFNDVKSIKSLRLTCHRLCHASSRHLLHVLDYYSAAIAGSLGLFSSLAGVTLDRQLDELDRRFQESGVSYSQEQIDVGFGRAENAADVWNIFAEDLEHGSLQSDYASISPEAERNIAAIKRGHALYIDLYSKQELVMRNGAFLRAIADAIARMPTAVRLSVTDSGVPDKKSVLYKGILDCMWDPYNPDAYLEEEVIKPWTLNEPRDVAQEAPTDLLYRLPLAISAASISLTAIDIDITSPISFPCNLTEDQMRALETACQRVKTFKFHTEISEAMDDTSYDHGMAGFYKFLSACMAERIEDLELKFQRSPVSWPWLFVDRSRPAPGAVKLDSIPIHLHRLRDCLGSNETYRVPILHIILAKLQLMGGNWAGALDVMHKRIVSGLSGVEHPRGGEMEINISRG
ncbi:hypothetical protein VMCG_05371 [Cytospora schulzeri]|uniref:Uncharacterized protein n=1 Tax=Cytospora schulzeri TaxID=448051 RepID=A0A423WJY3_9PEZI|nr:hypothetical protein VMCG_05371 [Valsa malicola]